MISMTKTTGRSAVLTLTLTAVLTATVYVFTAFVNIRLPIAANGGLIHLGNVPLFIGAILFGKRVGAVSGGVGMALFDLLSGWTLWAPFTLIVVGLMGYTVGLIAENSGKVYRYILAILAALAIKIAGYYIAEAIIYQNITVPAASIAGNVIQVAVAGIVTIAVIAPLNAARKHIFS